MSLVVPLVEECLAWRSSREIEECLPERSATELVAAYLIGQLLDGLVVCGGSEAGNLRGWP